ncbi:MAG: hypothetical protein HC804_05985 [Anaerolineae bacterium]|nr:hypothetical protein [Anaerolineae bacterium]
MNEMDKETERLLALTEPTDHEAPQTASLALAQVKQRVAVETISTTPSWSDRLQDFLVAPGRRYALASVMAVLMLIFAFSFPTVRAAASEFLSLFRVQNFAAITIRRNRLPC